MVQVIDAGNKSSNFLQLRAHQFHFSKSASHQSLPPTSKGLEPHIYRAFFNAYATMHVLDRQLNVQTADLDPLDYGFLHENGNLLPSTSWRSLEPCWGVVCHCGKCARVTCPCLPTAYVEWCPRTVMALHIFLSCIAVAMSVVSSPVSCFRMSTYVRAGLPCFLFPCFGIQCTS